MKAWASACPKNITVHLDAGYDSAKTRDLLAELGCRGVISVKGLPLQAGKRWVIERTNSWHNRGFKKLAICTERRVRVISKLETSPMWRGNFTTGGAGPMGCITARRLAEAWGPCLRA